MSEPLTREDALEKDCLRWEAEYREQGRALIAKTEGQHKAEAERNTLRAQLEWCESERNAARARCEQLDHANGDLLGHLERSNGEIETLRARCRNWESLYAVKEKRCEKLEAALEPFAALWAKIPQWMRDAAEMDGRVTVDGERITSCAAVNFKKAHEALENSTIAPESPAKEPA